MSSQRMPRSERRVQLLNSAREIFVEHGYHAAAMDEIAERAGVSKPVLYQHFPGKLDLYVALLDDTCDEVISGVRDALASIPENRDRVAATMRSFYSYVTSAQGAFRLVFESDLTNEPQVRARLDRVTLECGKLIGQVLEEDTDLSTHQAHLLAVGLVGLGQVSARYWLDNPGELTANEASDLVSGLAWRGIRGYPRADERSADNDSLPSDAPLN